jgi:hypothetical protein
MLQLPNKYTDLKEIKKVTNDDINWLINFYKKTDGRDNKMAEYVFKHIRI